MVLIRIPHPMPKFITFLSSLLQRVAQFNDDPYSRFHPRARTLSVFHALTQPTISFQSYMERIFKYANCSPSCFVVAYIYLDRFAERRPELPIDSFSVHRFIITSVMLASKFMGETCYNNDYFAKVGGISTLEMNFLEMGFLFGVDFRLNVSPFTFCSYYIY